MYHTNIIGIFFDNFVSYEIKKKNCQKRLQLITPKGLILLERHSTGTAPIQTEWIICRGEMKNSGRQNGLNTR